jgi:hypothetical protein
MNRWDSRRRAARCIPPDDALGTALYLAGRVLWVMPITPPDDPLSLNPGKASIGRGWGARRLSTRVLLAIFRPHPRAGVGLVLGPAAGVVDLEVDNRNRAGPLLSEFFPGSRRRPWAETRPGGAPPLPVGRPARSGGLKCCPPGRRRRRVPLVIGRQAAFGYLPAVAGRRRPAPPLERCLGDGLLLGRADHTDHADVRRRGSPA